MSLKKHDFIEVEYTGRLKENNAVFDTTDEKTAKESGLQQQNRVFSPAIVCLGENHILKGIEDVILGKEPGSFRIELSPEKAFGKKNAKLLRLVPMKVFAKENIRPFPGLEVNIDNMYGIVRSASGGRVIVDFNHPLSGRDVVYDVNVKRVVEDASEKVKAILKNELNVTDMPIELEKDKLALDEKIPKEVFEALKKRLLELVPELKHIVLREKKEDKKEEKAEKAE